MTDYAEPTNRNRAAWADVALSAFRDITCCDEEDALGDLLCDLMHWSLQHGCDFAAALDRARYHHEAELLEERPVPLNDAALPALVAALEQAVGALNTAPRFPVPWLHTDSYRIARVCDRALADAKGAGQ